MHRLHLSGDTPDTRTDKEPVQAATRELIPGDADVRDTRSRMNVRPELKIPWAAASEVSPLGVSIERMMPGESSVASGGKWKFHTISFVPKAAKPTLPPAPWFTPSTCRSRQDCTQRWRWDCLALVAVEDPQWQRELRDRKPLLCGEAPINGSF